jgi:phosphoglycerate dehydrogenase-like enzyme
VCDADFFDAMKPTAVFLNAGRGSLIKNDQVLIDALQQGKIKAAVLDVFTQEPLSGTHPFYHLKNCYLTNHTAAVSNPEAVCAVFLQNLERFVASQPLLYQHDFNKGY